MIRKLISLLAFAVLLSAVPTDIKEVSAAPDNSKIFIEDEEVTYEVPPVVKDGVTLLPFRKTLEAMGATVSWDKKTEEIAVKKADQHIKVTVGKKHALVNGKKVKLDHPAIVHEGRTLIPLRFIGEALGGSVYYDQKTGHIYIDDVLPKPDPKPEYTLVDSKLFIEDEEIEYDVPPVIKNGVTLVPVRKTLEAMGATVYWDNETEKIIVRKFGQHIEFIIGEKEASVNGQKVKLNQPAIVLEGRTLLPVRFVGEALGDSVHFDPVTTNIYITLSDFTSSFLPHEQGEIKNITTPKDVKLVDERRLMVSDNPERLDERTVTEDDATLWHDVVQEDKETLDHRVFGWHTNDFSHDVTVGITIENLSSTNTIEVVDFEGVERLGQGNYEREVGLPITEAVISNELTEKTVEVRDDVMLLDTFKLTPGNMVGFLNDFTVKKTSGTGELDYVIRTVVTKGDTDLTTINTPPVPLDLDRSHPRGVWSGSTIEATLPVVNISDNQEISYSLSNGQTDDLFSKENSLMDESLSIGNRGHFGVVYIVKIPYENKDLLKDKLRVRIGARGGIYSGTLKTEAGIFNVSSLQPHTEYVTLLEREVDESGCLEFEFMHAGGSSLPLALSIDITIE